MGHNRGLCSPLLPPRHQDDGELQEDDRVALRTVAGCYSVEKVIMMSSTCGHPECLGERGI